jgi:hypothetical protein
MSSIVIAVTRNPQRMSEKSYKERNSNGSSTVLPMVESAVQPTELTSQTSSHKILRTNSFRYLLRVLATSPSSSIKNRILNIFAIISASTNNHQKFIVHLRDTGNKTL